MAARVLPPRARRAALAERLAMTGTEVERVEHHGVDRARAVRGRQGARGRPPPRRRPAQRVPGRHRRRRAQPDRVRRAQRRRRPDGGGGQARRGHARRHQAQGGQAPRPGVQRDDPGRGRGRRSAPSTPGSWCSTTRSPPGRRWRRCCRSPPTCSCSRSPPTGPTASAIYGVAREVHAATGAPLAPPPWAQDPIAARRRRARRGRDRRRVPRPVPALHRPRVRGREDRARRRRG